MVDRVGGYFGLPFKGYHGVTKGYPLPPMIFNLVMDAVIYHWVTVVMVTKEVKEGLGM